VHINRHIGRRPLVAIGNSDGDQATIQYTLARDGPRLGLLLHHDDGDRDFHLSPLNQALEAIPRLGSHIISMKQDFKQVFPQCEGRS